MSTGLKVRFLRATAFSIVTFGCESWAMTTADKKRVEATLVLQDTSKSILDGVDKPVGAG